MKLKKSLDDVIYDIEEEVKFEVTQAFKAPSPEYYGQEVNISINDLIAKAITKGVTVGIRKLIENQYTDEDFENDMGITDY